MISCFVIFLISGEAERVEWVDVVPVVAVVVSVIVLLCVID